MQTQETRTVVVRLEASEPPSVVFTGGYVTNKELDLVMRAIKRQHRFELQQFRKRRIIEEWEAQKKVEVLNDRSKSDESSNKSSESNDGSGKATSASNATRPGSADGSSSQPSSGSVARGNPVAAAAVR